MPESAGLNRFLLLYGLAWAGCSIAYIPFLTILLPVRVTTLAGPGADVAWMAYLAFSGAIAASLGHIGFGYLSDITGNRRLWIASGMTISTSLLIAIPSATNLAGLILLLIAWQLALNMMLAPLAAWAGDCIPDRRKGVLGGLMAFAPGIGALSGAAVTSPGFATPDNRLVIVAALVVACVLPALIIGPPRAVARLPMTEPVIDENKNALRGAMRRMWFARLAVQVAEAALFAYLFFWFRSIDPTVSDNRTAIVFSAILTLSAPLALLVGSWADRKARPLLPLVGTAAVSACALVSMALARDLATAIATYSLFGIASAVFLALHSAQTLRVLPRSDRRGRDLGLFNLTNTLPSLVMPWLALALVPSFGFSGLFLIFALLAVVASAILWPLVRHA